MTANQTFTLGLIQMRCSDDPAENLRARVVDDPRGGDARRAGDLPAGAVRVASTSARRRTTRTSISPSRSRARRRRRWARSPPRRSVVVIGSLFERRAAGIYHNTAVVIDADGIDARHVSQDAHPRRSALLREVLLHARRSRLPRVRHRARAHRHAGVLGPVVSGRARASPRSRAPTCCSIPTAIGWHPVGEGGVRRGAGVRGRPSSARTPSRTASTSPRSTASGHEKLARVGGTASSSGAVRSCADPFGVVLTEALAHRGRDPDRASATAATKRRCAGTGRSCAIAASTPTRRSPGATSTRPTDRSRTTPAALGYRMPAEWEPHAGDLARVAARARRLAGQAGADPLGLRRGGAPPGARRARAHPGRATRPPSARRARCWCAWASTSGRSTSSACRPIAAGRATSARCS